MRYEASLLALLVGCGSGDPSRPSAAPAAATEAGAPVTAAPPPDASTSPTAEIVVGIERDALVADPTVPEVVGVHVQAEAGGRMLAEDSIYLRADALPRETRIIAPPDLVDAEVVIRVGTSAVDTPGASYGGTYTASPRSVRTIRTRFSSGKVQLARVGIESACVYLATPCADPEATCVHGACTSSSLTDLPPYRADWYVSPCLGAGAPVVTLYDGATPIADNHSLVLEHGPQGGAHFWLTLGLSGFAPKGVVVVLSAVQPDTKTAALTTGVAVPSLYVAADGACRTEKIQYRVDSAALPIASIHGHPLDVTVLVTDPEKHSATVTRRVAVP